VASESLVTNPCSMPVTRNPSSHASCPSGHLYALGNNMPMGQAHRNGNANFAASSLTLEEYHVITAAQKKAYLRAKNTMEAYDGQVARAKEFLATLLTAKREASALNPGQSKAIAGAASPSSVPAGSAPTEPDPADLDIDLDMLSHAFDATPNRYSAMAIEYFMVEKCLNQNRKASTAINAHAAFCHFWDQS
jgi:hypothetical protein